MVRIEEVYTAPMADERVLGGLMNSLGQERPTPTARDISRAFGGSHFHLFLAKEGAEVIGMASICYQRVLSGWFGEIHDVVVAPSHRGQGIGKSLMKRLRIEAHRFAISEFAPVRVSLTSRPHRTVANAMHQQLGFTLVALANGKSGTNLYRRTITVPRRIVELREQERKTLAVYA